MLTISNLAVQYGAFRALHNISLTVEERKLISIIGANGAGKTTLINTISGLLRPVAGEILFEGQSITQLESYVIAELGIIQVPEGRKLFPDMTVYENLLMGSYTKRAKQFRQESLELVYHLFPILEKRMKQLAGTLSGGEQQMLAIGRAVMAKPRLIMFDEPSLGLAPLLVRTIYQIIQQLKESGMTILLVEQNVRQSLQISDYAYVLESGQIILAGPSEEVLQNEHTRQAYLGI